MCSMSADAVSQGALSSKRLESLASEVSLFPDVPVVSSTNTASPRVHLSLCPARQNGKDCEHVTPPRSVPCAEKQAPKKEKEEEGEEKGGDGRGGGGGGRGKPLPL